MINKLIPDTAEPRPWDNLTTAQLAVELGLHPFTLCNWRVQGRGPAYVQMCGKAIRYRRQDITAWLEAQVRTSTSQEIK